MNQIYYSIIFAVTRPEITERLSIGLLFVDKNNHINVRYSKNKLNVLKLLFTEKELEFIRRTITNLRNNRYVNSIETIDYLTRYSNNLITFSPLQCLDLEPTQRNIERIYKNFIYQGKR